MGAIHLIYRINNCVGFSLALLLNTLLLWLIWKRSPQELRTYSIILVQTCVVDLLFALELFLAMPIITVVNHSLVMLQGGWLAWTPLPVNFWLVSSTTITYVFSFSALGAQFLYRYLMVVRGIQLTSRQYTAMLGVPFALAALSASLLYTGWYATPVLMNQTAAALGPMLEVPSEGLIVPVIANPESIASGLQNLLILGTCTGTYALIISCIYKVGWWELKTLWNYLPKFRPTESCGRPDFGEDSTTWWVPRNKCASSSTGRSVEPWPFRHWSLYSLNYCRVT